MTPCCDHTRNRSDYHELTGKPCVGWGGAFPVGSIVVNRGEPNTMVVIEVSGDSRLCEGTERDGSAFKHAFPVESLHDVRDCIRVR